MNPSNFKVNYHNELKISTLGIGSYQGKPDFDDDVKVRFIPQESCLDQSSTVSHREGLTTSIQPSITDI